MRTLTAKIILTIAWLSYYPPFSDRGDELLYTYEGYLRHDIISNVSRKRIAIIPIPAHDDAPAKTAAKNIIQYNGSRGCGSCENPGMGLDSLNRTRVVTIRQSISAATSSVETANAYRSLARVTQEQQQHEQGHF